MQISDMSINWFYTTEGQGDPVLFLHGGFDTCTNYTHLLNELANEFKVIAVDRRGHGRTADTDAPFDYALMAEEMIAFMHKLNVSSFHIIGYSDGANIGLHMASGYPEKIKKLVAISGNYKASSGMSEGCLGMFRALSFEFVQKYMPEVLEQYLELNPNPAPKVFIAKTKDLWNQECVIKKELLEAFRVPTLLVGGDRDMVLPEQLVEMKTLIPNSSLLLLPYCGHFIFQDFVWSSTAASAVGMFKEFLMTGFVEHNTEFI